MRKAQSLMVHLKLMLAKYYTSVILTAVGKAPIRLKKLSLLNKLSAVQRDLIAAGERDLAKKVILAKFYANGNIQAIP